MGFSGLDIESEWNHYKRQLSGNAPVETRAGYREDRIHAMHYNAHNGRFITGAISSPELADKSMRLLFSETASEVIRWSARRKAAVVTAVHLGIWSTADVGLRFNISAAEFGSWEKSLNQKGLHGLSATKLKVLEPQRRKVRRSPG